MNDRQHSRIPLALEVSYRSAGAFLVAYTTNLSKGGVFIETEELLPVGTEITLRLAVPGEISAELAARVAWVSEHAEGGHGPGMGLNFEHMDLDHGDFIDRLVSRFRGLKVLLVGADAASRTLVARMVKTVISTADVREVAGADAGEKALLGEVDVLLVDLSPIAREPKRKPGAIMPSASEHLLLVRIAKAHEPPVPVIALAQDADRRTLALELGADAALASPPPVGDLQAELLRLLGRPSLALLR